MEKETIKNILDFLEEEDNKNKPFKWKLINGEPLTDDELNFNGSLDLSNTNIISLPEGLEVGGDLDLSYTNNLISIPKKIKIDGDLNLEGSKIKSLPEGLEVGWDLILTLTEIESLPKGLKVGHDLLIGLTQFGQYDEDDIRYMIKPGVIRGKIYY